MRQSRSSARRIEYRPRVRDNVYGLALFTGLGVFFVALMVFTRAWNSGLWTIGATAVLVLAFTGLPWTYLLTAMLWLDDEQVGAERLLVMRKRVPRDKVRRVIAGMKLFFIGPDDRVLLAVSRFWSDDQVRAVAADLGLQAEGYARYMGGPL
jgi:hypothetical protein